MEMGGGREALAVWLGGHAVFDLLTKGSEFGIASPAIAFISSLVVQDRAQPVLNNKTREPKLTSIHPWAA